MKSILFGALALASFATPALAGPVPQGKFAGSVSASVDSPVDGDVHGGRTTAILPGAAVLSLFPAATLPPTATGARLNIDARSFEDIYGEAFGVAIEGAYGLGGGRELFGAVGYLSADEGSVQVGTADVLGAGNAILATAPVFGRFGEYQATTIEGGVRQFFNLQSPLKPYIAGRIGAAFVDEIRASFTIPAVNIAANNVPFYDETTVVTLGLDVGISYDVTDRFSVQAETGVRYAGDLDGNDAVLSALDLSQINEEGSRLSVPVTVKARFAF